jgi:hypothetical protein
MGPFILEVQISGASLCLRFNIGYRCYAASEHQISLFSQQNVRKFSGEVSNNASTRSQQSGSNTTWSSQRG